MTGRSIISDAASLSKRRSRKQIDALVLDRLRREDRPASAYKIAASDADGGDPLLANQVYRTLERLIADGRAHRIETLAAYVRRDGPFDSTLVCTGCRAVQLMPDPILTERLVALASARGFSIDRLVVEVLGRCSVCQSTAIA